MDAAAADAAAAAFLAEGEGWRSGRREGLERRRCGGTWVAARVCCGTSMKDWDLGLGLFLLREGIAGLNRPWKNIERIPYFFRKEALYYLKKLSITPDLCITKMHTAK